ncbi:MAG: glycosyltransferase family 4 protein, partial [Kiritimatiellae bacterium]|nr:glycosyltransferase family 4 protein [Kiritimatiellia bacterium]
MASRSEVELGIAFFDRWEEDPVRVGRTTYFPMRRRQSLFARADRFFRISAQDARDLSLCQKVVEKFRPDVIHVFGTESVFGLLSGATNVPVVIHLQGLLGPCLNAWVPPGWTMLDYARHGSLSPIRAARGLRSIAYNRHGAIREREIMRRGRFFMGRTEWDKAFVSTFAPHAEYRTVWETLRPCFYDTAQWKPPHTPTFVSTLSRPLYKGHDMVLKTAMALCQAGLHDFVWRVFGVSDLSLAEVKTGIRASDVGVIAEGVATAEALRDALLSASVYVHPSYIDNSPNSVCEAQILGVPVVATAVGGVPSLFPSDRTRCLVPANDPLMASARICEALSSPDDFACDVSAIRLRHAL